MVPTDEANTAAAGRVCMSYELELLGSTRRLELPLRIGVLASLSGTPEIAPKPFAERRFRRIDQDGLNSQMAFIRPRLLLEVPDTLKGEGMLPVSIEFRALEDFSPLAVARQIGPLAALLARRDLLAGLLAFGVDHAPASPATLAAALTLLDSDIALASNIESIGMLAPRREVLMPQVCRLIQQLAARYEWPVMRASRRWMERSVDAPTELPDFGTIRSLIEEVDATVSKQLTTILHHPSFQTLEGSWRGLAVLVQSSTVPGAAVEIEIFDTSVLELQKSLRKFSGIAWDQSPLARKVWDEAFGALGEAPFAYLIVDHCFDHSRGSIDTLGDLAQLGEAARFTVVAGAAPGLFGMESWRELPRPRDLHRIFDAPDYLPWRSLRAAEKSRYLALALPRVLARVPYKGRGIAMQELDYSEPSGAGDPASYVWSNAAYYFAADLVRAFARHGWCGAIKGMESGGYMSGLPLCNAIDEHGYEIEVGPLEVSISDRRAQELEGAGLLTFLRRQRTDGAAFLSTPSLHASPPQGAQNGNVPADLSCMFAINRVMHYLKCMTRDRSSPVRSREQLQQYLSAWLDNYVATPGTSRGAAEPAYPLSSASVVVEEHPDSINRYKVSVRIEPCYQMRPATLAAAAVFDISRPAF